MLYLKPINDSVFLLSVFSLYRGTKTKHGQKEHGVRGARTPHYPMILSVYLNRAM